MYRVGDFVFFEQLPSVPYQIRKIEELNRCPNGTVEAKVLCFLRRRDLNPSMVEKADQQLRKCISADPTIEGGKLSPQEFAKIADRELFLNRQIETVSATCIRGKCNVTLYNETESLMSYLAQDDRFFYSLVYDPLHKTLNSDKGEIRIGPQFQAIIGDDGDSSERSLTISPPVRDQLLWSAAACPLSEGQLQDYLLLTRSLATLARSSHLPTCIRQPNLVHTAAAAARDITTERALQTLHHCQYDISRALACMLHADDKSLANLPHENGTGLEDTTTVAGTLALWRDEMELWSISESNLFEEALEKYAKYFPDIRTHYLPWKSVQSIVAYYYLWKTTEPYVLHRHHKAAASENRLRQVYIPNYTHQPNSSILYPPSALKSSPQSGCESCHASFSPLWYAWARPGTLFKLCENCWQYWKKYGALKARLGDAISLDEPQSADHGDASNCKDPQHAALPPSDSTVMTRCLAPPVGEGCEAILPAHFHVLVRHMMRVHAFTEEYSTMLAASCLQHAKPLSILLNKLHAAQSKQSGNQSGFATGTSAGSGGSSVTTPTSTSTAADKLLVTHISMPLLRLARNLILPELLAKDKKSEEAMDKDGDAPTPSVARDDLVPVLRSMARKAGVVPPNKLPWDKASLVRAYFAKMATISLEEANEKIRPRSYAVPSKALSAQCEGGMRRVYSRCKSWFDPNIVSGEVVMDIDTLFLAKPKASTTAPVPEVPAGDAATVDSVVTASGPTPSAAPSSRAMSGATPVMVEAMNATSEMLYFTANIRDIRTQMGANMLRMYARRPTSEQLCEVAVSMLHPKNSTIQGNEENNGSQSSSLNLL